MLLIDGVKYELWTPSTEEEFEWEVRKHTQEIFGEESVYFDLKKKLTTKAGIGSIPDGYVISFREPPCWYICEVELHTHPLYEHVVPQMTKFINGVKSLSSQREIINAFYGELNSDPFKEALVRSKIGSAEVYRFISDLISKPPILVIVIDQRSKELEEVCDSLPIEVKIVELKTFTREGVGLPVHVHLFEPLYKPAVRIEPPKVVRPLVTETQKLEHTLTQRDLKMKRFRIPKRDKGFFPPPYVDFELMTDIGVVKTNGRGHGDPLFIQRNLREWFRKHPDLKVGDKAIFRVTEPMRRYRLEVLKE